MIFSPRDMFYAHHSTPLDTTGFACWASNDNNEHTNTFECASCYLTLPHKIWVIIKSRNWIIDYRRDKVCFFFSPFYFLFLFFLVFLFFTFIFVFFFVWGLCSWPYFPLFLSSLSSSSSSSERASLCFTHPPLIIMNRCRCCRFFVFFFAQPT